MKKCELRGTLEDKFEEIMNTPSYMLSSKVIKRKNVLCQKGDAQMLYEKNIAEESKKRFLIQVPKLRYDSI